MSDPTTERVQYRALPQPKPDILPSDFYVGDSGKKGGTQIGSKVDHEVSRTVDLIIQMGDEFGGAWPRTRSDVLRNAITMYARNILGLVTSAAAGSLAKRELVDLLTTLHHEYESYQMQAGEKMRKEALHQTHDITADYMKTTMADGQHKLAQVFADQYLDRMREYALLEPDKARYAWTRMTNDAHFQRMLAQLEINGYPVRRLEEDEFDSIIKKR